MKSKGYRVTNKRRKIWSMQAHKAKERKRIEGEPPEYPAEISDYIRIQIDREATGEHIVYDLLDGTRSDNYTVYCNGQNIGVMGISKLMRITGKALPSFKTER